MIKGGGAAFEKKKKKHTHTHTKKTRGKIYKTGGKILFIFFLIKKSRQRVCVGKGEEGLAKNKNTAPINK